jgi:signal transduction histidine kinase
VEEYTRRFADASKLAVVVEATPEARAAVLSPEAEAQVFRIIQESLTNVRKHADAHRATLTLDVDGSTLVIRVVDDGRGFVPSGSPPSGSPAVGWPHYGLDAMRERAASIGGTIEWSSVADTGAAVRLAVPVAPAPAPVEARAENGSPA